MRAITLLVSLLLCSCVTSYVERPVAYLVVDGKSYEMVSGSSCWDYSKDDYMCDDSFAITTQIKPIEISNNSKVELRLKAKSGIKKIYMDVMNSRYYTLGQLPVDDSGEEEMAYIKYFSEKFLIWEEKPEYVDFLESDRELRMNELLPTLNQSIENNFEQGQHIISVGTWWTHGDASFDILVVKK